MVVEKVVPFKRGAVIINFSAQVLTQENIADIAREAMQRELFIDANTPVVELAVNHSIPLGSGTDEMLLADLENVLKNPRIQEALLSQKLKFIVLPDQKEFAAMISVMIFAMTETMPFLICMTNGEVECIINLNNLWIGSMIATIGHKKSFPRFKLQKEETWWNRLFERFLR